MIIFRADANETVATGHLMRCMTIADACREKGVECEFWLAEDKETERLRQAGFSYRILGSQWDDLEKELPFLERQLDDLDRQGKKVTYLVADSYQATPHYLGKLNDRIPVLYIDDMRMQIYPVAAVLQYIPVRAENLLNKEESKQNTPVYLRGFRYAPLRKEFLKSHGEQREKSILITTGGTDTYNIAGRLLQECLDKDVFQGYRFHVIVGNMNSHEAELRRLSESNKRICIHKNISNMSDYMRTCELAVSASGTTLLELCACGIPTICFSFADNQMEFAASMDNYGAVCYVGDAREEENIERIICMRLTELALNAGNVSLSVTNVSASFRFSS